MDEYDPLIGPDTQAWMTVPEAERIELVRAYHQRANVELPKEQLHVVIHVVVENQVALGDELPVAGVLQRLMSEGLDRHEAIHAIGSVLAEHLFDLMRAKDAASPDNGRYFSRLKKLSAKSWRRGH